MKQGDYAKYRSTGTVGRVLEVQERDEVEWALLDTFNLWYDTSLLDPALADEYKRTPLKERTHAVTTEDIESLTEEVMYDISSVSPSGAG